MSCYCGLMVSDLYCDCEPPPVKPMFTVDPSILAPPPPSFEDLLDQMGKAQRAGTAMHEAWNRYLEAAGGISVALRARHIIQEVI